MIIHCCGCGRDVDARLTDGREIYPRRPQFADLPYWKCDACGNYVGCHHKTGKPTTPLGVIPTPEIRNARQHIHRHLDPLWQSGKVKRRHVYRMVADAMGRRDYHTSDIRSVEEAREVFRAVRKIARDLGIDSSIKT